MRGIHIKPKNVSVQIGQVRLFERQSLMLQFDLLLRMVQPSGCLLCSELANRCIHLWTSASGLLCSAMYLYSFVVLICAALILWSLRSVLMCCVPCTDVAVCSDLLCFFFCLLHSALVSSLVVLQCFAVAVCCRFQVDLGYA